MEKKKPGWNLFYTRQVFWENQGSYLGHCWFLKKTLWKQASSQKHTIRAVWCCCVSSHLLSLSLFFVSSALNASFPFPLPINVVRSWALHVWPVIRKYQYKCSHSEFYQNQSQNSAFIKPIDASQTAYVHACSSLHFPHLTGIQLSLSLRERGSPWKFCLLL